MITWTQAAARQIAIMRGAKRATKKDKEEAEALLLRANITREKAGLPLWE